MAMASDSLLGAFRFCFVVNFVNLIPIVVLIVLVITSGAYALYLPCIIIPRFLSLALQALAFTHTHDG
jgi:hypothetical protein